MIPAQTRDSDSVKCDEKKKELLESNKSYLCNSIESRLIRPRSELSGEFGEDFEENNEFGDLLKLCSELEEQQEEDNGSEEEINGLDNVSVQCPLCGFDISDLNEEQRQVHTNDCLDKVENQAPTVSL